MGKGIKNKGFNQTSFFSTGTVDLLQIPQVSPAPTRRNPLSPHFRPHEFWSFQEL